MSNRMTVSFSGLDLSFLKDPANRLPPRPKTKRTRVQDKRATGIAVPYFLRDEITPFIAHATKKPVEINSRSTLKRYERENGLRQAGDIKPGTIVAENRKRQAELLAKTQGVPSAWTDFQL